jgi:hypothetical protein
MSREHSSQMVNGYKPLMVFVHCLTGTQAGSGRSLNPWTGAAEGEKRVSFSSPLADRIVHNLSPGTPLRQAIPAGSFKT